MIRFTKGFWYRPFLRNLHLYFPWSLAAMLVRRTEQSLLFSDRNICARPRYVPLKSVLLLLCLSTSLLLGSSCCHLNSLSRSLSVQLHGRRTLSPKKPVTVSSSPTVEKVKSVQLLRIPSKCLSLMDT